MTDEVPAEMVQRTKMTASVPMVEARQLRTLASQGSFAVDDTTGDKMIAALEGVVDALQARWSALQKVGRTPQMSDSPAAQWVSKQMTDTAADQQGLLTQLQAAKDAFPTYVEAIRLAKQNYKDREHTSRETFKTIGRSEELS
ncbi:hypothetical protein [Amycolatopsis benzoatilytica]|uniref:hypothetical protein n=1 Tax=Amycolatopsis benzoatilytica TaxID=346045 RepID=UPI000366F3CD|nr:hypothetical protein [Amycolatopsis benzoatilytica]